MVDGMVGILCSMPVCNRCHEDKPVKDFTPDRRKKSGVQGNCRSCARVRRVERRGHKKVRVVPLDKWRDCGRCGQTLRLTSYAKASPAPYDYNYYCRSCVKAAATATNKAKTERMRAIKLSSPCTDCGEFFDDPSLLDFDHLPGTIKLFGVADGCRKKGWAAIEAEMGKCEVVCKPCHRKRTLDRGEDGWAGSKANLAKLASS